MTFWALDRPARRPALADHASGAGLSYGELARQADAFAGLLAEPGRKTLGFILARNEAPTLVAYFAALRSGQAVALLDAGLDARLLRPLIDAYRPDWVVAPAEHPVPAGYQEAGPGPPRLLRRAPPPAAERPAIHAELALLLSTSGSTGSAKMVRLSYRNLDANAAAIADYLELDADHRGAASLPLHYCYGLSVVHRHLAAGASVLLTGASLVERGFWDFLEAQGATLLAGVPYTFEVLERMRFERLAPSSLRILTQAGGRLEPSLVRRFHALAVARGWRFFVMYGQTEASARISFVPPERLPAKAETVGVPIPGGRMWIDEQSGELVYSGPNVMLGYAQSRADLGRGDEMGGRLDTGDLASVDQDGFFRIVGRRTRFIKLYGLRLGLDELERALSARFGVPAVCLGDDRRLEVVVEDAVRVEAIATTLVDLYGLHRDDFRVHGVSALPRLASGKVAYDRLRADLGAAP